MSCLRLVVRNRPILILMLIAVRPDSAAVQGAAIGPVIVDGPWTSLPAGAAQGLSLDGEWGAITLKPDLTEYAFVLSPDPSKAQSANIVQTLATYDNRLYLGYGDIGLNLGPVDIVAYDPLTGRLIHEMLALPEEGLARWHVSTTGRLYVAGADIKSSSPFGNFFVNDGLGWQKRSTIPAGAHVFKVAECKGRLFARSMYSEPSPVDYPYILMSDNQGASWTYEQIATGPIDRTQRPETSQIINFQTVSHHIQGRFTSEAEFLYVIARWSQLGKGVLQGLWRFDGTGWKHIAISIASGEVQPSDIPVVFNGQLIVFGGAQWELRELACAIDGKTLRELPFLTPAKAHLGLGGRDCCAVCDGWLYWVMRDAPGTHHWYAPCGYQLWRTQDLSKWEMVGPVVLSPGVRPHSLGFAHGRMYVGGTSMWGYLYTAPDQLYPAQVYPIHNSSLEWDADVPDGAQVGFKIRTILASEIRGGNDLEVLPCVGPDGTETTMFITPGQILHPQHDGDDVFQVVVCRTPNGDGQYPHVRSVTLNSPGGRVTMAVDEGSGLYTAITSTDPNGAEYLSQVFALEEPVTNGSISLESAAPDGTSVRLQVRSAAGQDALLTKSFVGPDGSAGTFYEPAGQPLWDGHDGDTYIQYRAALVSSDPVVAPFLRKVTLVTRADALDHFDVAVAEPALWTAGQANSITVTARSADGTLVPVRGSVSLSAMAENSNDAVPVQPTEITLVDGVDGGSALLQRAVPTRIFAELADTKGSSAVIQVQPGTPAAISVTTNLTEPELHWAPVGQVGQPFTLSLRILDRYRNTVTGYTGTVRFERWSDKCEGQLVPPYEFLPSDQGCHEFAGVVVDEPGEWNLVCSDETTPQVAGTLTVNMQ